MPLSGNDFTRARAEMVQVQLRDRGISDERLLGVMEEMPRHLFVAEKNRSEAYCDKPLVIPCEQTISQPYMVALMTELLELNEQSTVLEIGTGTGYQAAILGRLSGNVISIERHETLAKIARKMLRSVSIDNVTVKVGDGTLGDPDAAPFDRIMVTAGGPQVPAALKEQLADGGRLICPVGNRNGQRLRMLMRHSDGYEDVEKSKCRFVPLVGEQGWHE